MNITLKTNGTGCELHIVVNWKSLKKLVKALLAVVASILSFIAAPEIIKIGELLGLW